MKKILVLLLGAAVLLALAACGAENAGKPEPEIRFEKLWPPQGTIAIGGETYRFSRSGNTYTMTYPDGSRYYVKKMVGCCSVHYENGEDVAFARPWGSWESPYSLYLGLKEKREEVQKAVVLGLSFFASLAVLIGKLVGQNRKSKKARTPMP